MADPEHVEHLSRLRDPAELMPHAISWLSDNWLPILIAVGLGVALYFILLGARAFGMRLCRPRAGVPVSGFLTILRRALARTGHLFMALLAARLVVGYADPPATLLATIRFLFTVSAVIQGAVWLREAILGFIELRADPEGGGNETLANASGLLRVLVTSAIFVIASVVILDNIGVNVTGLVAGLGIGGIAIGLAAQGIFSDLFAALSILFDRPFRMGDTIAFDSSTGTVERIGLKTTRLRASTGERKIISNAKLLEKEITSYAGIAWRRYTFPLQLIRQTPPDLAATLPDVLREIVEGEGGVFVHAGFVAFGQSSIDFEVQFDIVNDTFAVIYETRHRIGLAILKRFAELGVDFAYPTQTAMTADPDGKLIMPYPAASAPSQG